MSDVRPFRGLRPRVDLAAAVASPPYDVLDSSEAREMAAGNPHSFLHVDKAEIDLPPDADLYGEPVYRKSLENFTRMIEGGVLIRDENPCFYLYQLTREGRVQNGVAVGCSVEEVENGKIKKHEFTRRDKEDDRAKHMQLLRANPGPVLFTYRARPEIRALLRQITGAKAPEYDFTADDGVRHALWVIDGERDVQNVRDAFAGLDAIYVADGHHRTAAAKRMSDHFKARNPNHKGDESYNHFLAVCFPDDELHLLGYHKLVADLNGLEPADFLARVAEKFEITPDAAPEPEGQLSWGMHLDGRWYRLHAKAGSFPAGDPVGSLDGSILQENLIAPILGITDVRGDARIDFVGGARGAAELERRCKKDMRVAFAFAPVTVAQIMAISDADAVMPPKSTWFEPKLRSGLIVRCLDGE